MIRTTATPGKEGHFIRAGAPVVLGLTALAAALGISCAALTVARPAAILSGQPLPDILAYDEPPVPVTWVQPTYPEFAREAQIQGTVVLHLKVRADGTVVDVHVARGITGLTDAAVDAVKRWVFRPAKKDQAPVDSWYEADLEFRLP